MTLAVGVTLNLSDQRQCLLIDNPTLFEEKTSHNVEFYNHFNYTHHIVEKSFNEELNTLKKDPVRYNAPGGSY